MIESGSLFLFYLGSFLLGSLPFGLWMARVFSGKDVRTAGSGNTGTTNVVRVAGFWPAGVLTFLLDAVKGIVLILPFYFGWVNFPSLQLTPDLAWSMGLFAVLGHCFSPWLRFHGGKGVATTFGILFLLAPWSGLVSAVGFGVAFFVSRTGAVGSLVGLFLGIAVHRVFYPAGFHLVFYAAILAVVLFRHDSNIEAMLNGRENRF